MQNECFDLLYKFFRNISHSMENPARDHERILVFMLSTRYSCRILMKLEFSRQTVEK